MSRRRSSAADSGQAAPAWLRPLHACAAAVWRVWQLLFVRQLRFKRVRGKLAVALEDKPGPAGAAPQADAQPADISRGELSALLSAAPGSCRSLRTLAAVEHGLAHKDPAGLFLFEVELPRLRVALRQLDGLAPLRPRPGC